MIYEINSTRPLEKKVKSKKLTFVNFLKAMRIKLSDPNIYVISPDWEVEFAQKCFIKNGGNIKECYALYKREKRYNLIKKIKGE